MNIRYPIYEGVYRILTEYPSHLGVHTLPSRYPNGLLFVGYGTGTVIRAYLPPGIPVQGDSGQLRPACAEEAPASLLRFLRHGRGGLR